MALKLKDLGINTQVVLCALAEQPATRRTLADKTNLSVEQVSRALNRLVTFELVNHPEEPGAGWTLSDAGYNLLCVTAPAPAPLASPDDETQEPPAVEDDGTAMDAHAAVAISIAAEQVSSLPHGDTDRDAAHLLAAMEIEVALDHVRTKLRSVAIPARAQRVYREVLSVLPPILVDALDPITTMVAAHNLQ